MPFEPGRRERGLEPVGKPCGAALEVGVEPRLGGDPPEHGRRSREGDR